MIQALIGILVAVLSVAPALGAQAAPTRNDARAAITDTLARLVFPKDTVRTYRWDVPVKGASSDHLEFMWEADWDGEAYHSGIDPYSLWLAVRWKNGGPHTGPLSALIAGNNVDPMINCVTCDLASFVDPHRDTAAVFARVENDRVVFIVEGSDAVHHIFPVIPETVTFTMRGGMSSSQEVLVNCRPDAHQDCVVHPPKPVPNADSAREENAPRQLWVVVARISDAHLLPNVSVTLKRWNGIIWKNMSSGGLGAFRLHQPPLGPILLIARCGQRSPHRGEVFGTEFVFVRPMADSTVQLMTDPDICKQPRRQRQRAR
jgi:hypothetical protein